MRQILRQLGPLRLTVLLILSLTVLFLLGQMIPQKAVLQKDLYLQWKAASPRLVGAVDLLGLTDIYTSPLAVALWSLFFVNLALVMWRRIPTVRALVAVHPGKIKSTAAILRTRAAGPPLSPESSRAANSSTSSKR